MATLAQKCKETLKPIIAPTVSSEEVIPGIAFGNLMLGVPKSA